MLERIAKRISGFLLAGAILLTAAANGGLSVFAASETGKVEIVPAVVEGLKLDRSDLLFGATLYARVLSALTDGSGESYVVKIRNNTGVPAEERPTVTLYPMELAPEETLPAVAAPAATPVVTPAAALTAAPTAAPSATPALTPTATPTPTPTPEPEPSQAPDPAAAPGSNAVFMLDDSDLTDDGSVHEDFVAVSYTEGLRLGTVTGNGVYYREEPSADGKKLGNLPKNTAVLVYALTNGWYKIIYNGATAYMSADYVSITEEGAASLGYGVVTGSVVNVREKPGVGFTVAGKLSEGALVRITGVSNGWYKIKADSLEGYMHGDYVEPCSESKAKSIQNAAQKPTSSGSNSSGGSGTPASDGSPTVEYGSSPYKALDGPNAEKIQAVLDLAHAQLGVPYLWGGTTRNGFDCSGFVQYVFKHLGYTDFPRTHQYTAGTKVTFQELKPGDLVFFSNNGAGVGHVGIYVGEGMFIHSPRPGKTVSYSSISSGYYYNHFLYGARIISD